MSQKEIEDVVLFQIDRTSKLAKQYSQREFDAINLDLTVDQWVLLKIIHEKKILSQRSLAQFSSRDPASITRTLDLLEKKKYLVRHAIPNNRRQYDVKLTDTGNDLIKNNMKMVKKHRQKSIKGISTQNLELLRDLLLQIQSNMRL